MKAFLFGKFLPFHNGHLAMIHFALEHCDQLVVIICCSDQELIDGNVRSKWIRASTNPVRVRCVVHEYEENDLPNTSVPSEYASRLWSDQFSKIVPDCGLLVSSEDYGPMVAKCMNIQHIFFDRERMNVRISARRIRENLYDNWNFLPAAVKMDFAIKIAVSGTESTGKSTLVRKLCSIFPASVVPEAGRDIITNSNYFTFSQLVKIAEVHAQNILQAVLGDQPLVIADTDIRITQSYSRFFLERELLADEWVEKANAFDLILYMEADVPFVQDGTRLCELQRNALDISHRAIYSECESALTELRGGWESKYATAIKAIEQLIRRKSRVQWYRQEKSLL